MSDGFFSKLTVEQKEAALAYRGEENLGSEMPRPDYETIRKKVRERFAKTLAYLARH